MVSMRFQTINIKIVILITFLLVPILIILWLKEPSHLKLGQLRDDFPKEIIVASRNGIFHLVYDTSLEKYRKKQK